MDNNVNPKKKSNIGIIILLVLIILGLGGYVIYDKVLSNKEVGEDKNKEKPTSIKVDSTKEYVYDAEYKYDNKYTEYDRGSEGEDKVNTTIDYYGIPVEYSYNKQSLANLKVPYININSDDANNANQKLEELYMEYAKEFDVCASDAKGEKTGGIGVSCSQILTYRTYQYDNILSVVVIDAEQATSTWQLHYTIYNFDLSNGSSIGYNDMLTKLGLNNETVLEKLKQKAKTRMDEIHSKWTNTLNLTEACNSLKDENGNPKYGTTNCYDITNQLLEKSITDNNILFFVDNDGNLNVMAILHFDFVQDGTRNHYLLKVEK